MSFLHTLVTYQATQGKSQIVNNSLFSNNWRYSKHTLVETPKHTLEARAGQRVQTRKVNVIGILKLCSRSLTLRLARDISTGVAVRESEVFKSLQHSSIIFGDQFQDPLWETCVCTIAVWRGCT